MTDQETLPELVAHRGNADEFPENTLAALQSAVDLGLRYVEFDVQLTADQVPVMLHDADLVRVAGRPDKVHEIDWPTLARIPVGEVARLGPRHASIHPSSLSDVVAALSGWDDVTAFVEVKRASLRRFGHEVVLRRTAEVLRPVLDACVLISFDLPAVRILRETTGARIGWVLERYDDAARREAESLQPEFLFCDHEDVPAAEARLWPGPWQWALYEVRDLATARRCRDLGSDFVETMTPRDLLRAYAEARRAC